MKKIFFTLPLLVLLLIAGVVYYRYYFVFGEGVKSGELNYVVKKGYLFKTYEGKMIQSGFKSSQMSGSIQSNEFIFSIEDEQAAQQMMTMGGRQIDLFYKEYKHALPWRGNSNFVVDSFVVRDAAGQPINTLPSTPQESLPESEEQGAIEESSEGVSL